MQRKPIISFLSLVLIGFLLLPGVTPILRAQTAPPPPTPQQLDQLLSPVALYPDALLAQITTASTNPQEILDVDNWLSRNPSLTGSELTNAAQQQGFDPAFLALVTFPDVIQMMADNIDDYAAIGQAVTANQAEVTASIQRLRAQAYAAGSLRSTEQQKVEVQQSGSQPIYVIQPANPNVVYVPQYNPTVVYTPGAAAAITFGVGIGIAALVASNQPWGWGGWGWNWGRGGVYYNRNPWGGVWVGGYRPPSIWYRPRPIYYNSRPGFGGNWGYRPPNYRPPTPYRRPVYRPPTNGRPSIQPIRPGNPGTRPPSNGGRPSIQPVPGNRPGQPGNGNRPGQPGNGNPGGEPGRPGGNPGSRPGGGSPPAGVRSAPQPGGQPRPSGQTRPAPGGGGQGRGPGGDRQPR